MVRIDVPFGNISLVNILPFTMLDIMLYGRKSVFPDRTCRFSLYNLQCTVHMHIHENLTHGILYAKYTETVYFFSLHPFPARTQEERVS